MKSESGAGMREEIRILNKTWIEFIEF